MAPSITKRLKMVTGTVIVLALYALLETIISLLFSGAMWIAKAIMDSSITVFSGGQNMIETFINLLPFSSGEGNNILNISSIMNGVSYGILVLIIFISIIRSISAPLTGEYTDNPVQIAVRVVVSVVAKTLIFGSGLFHFDGLLGVFGKWFGLVLSKISSSFNYSVFEGLSAGLTLNAAAYIGQLVLFAALLGSVLGAAITYIERILSFAVYVIIGPVAVSMYASKETEGIAKEWVMGIFTQFGAIAVSLMLWSAFLNQIEAIEGFYISGWQIDDLIFKLAIAIAILSLVKNSEKIFNMFGLRTMPNIDSARSIAGGAATLASGALMALRLAPAAKEGIAKGMHGSMPAQGGKGSGNVAGRPANPYTGNASLYDSNGNLSVKGGDGQGSNAFRRAVARSGGNWNSQIAGPNSIRAAQNRQSSAIENLSNSISGQSAGFRVTGASIADNKRTEAKNYTGAQLGNLALSGHANGSGNGFRFTAGEGSKQIGGVGSSKFNVSGGSVQNVSNPSFASNAVMSRSSNADASIFNSSDLVVGKATSINGTDVTGVAGSAIFDNQGNGRVSDVGTYFMPVEGGGLDNELATGTKVDLGDGNDWYVTGDGIRIDDYGAKVYELATPPEPSRVEISNVGDFEELFNADGNNLFESAQNEVLDIQDFGEENVEDNNQIDPSIFDDDEIEED